MPAGPGVRDDSGVAAGSVISVYYDPMISKLCTWGLDRRTAIERMRRALGEYQVGGIRTNLAFHRKVMRHPAFLSGDYDTGFIERHRAELQPDEPSDTDRQDAAIAVALAAARAAPAYADSPDAPDHAGDLSAWRREVLLR